MQLRIIARGAFAGALAGLLSFVFTRIFAEPLINKAIDYESGRHDILTALNMAAGRSVAPDGPSIFSRSIQSTVGAASGLVGFSAAMGALIAVAYLVLHGRYAVRPMYLVWGIAAFGFLGVFALPYAKYPANPPSIGHTFTITTRGHLYLGLVICSLVLLGAAVLAARFLAARIGWGAAAAVSAVAFFVVYGALIAALPSLGNLSANQAVADQFGFAKAATETPQPITNILSQPLTVKGTTYQPGALVYPGFDADLLWKFRWYALLNQLLIWTSIAVGFGALLDRYVRPRTVDRPTSQPDLSAAITS